MEKKMFSLAEFAAKASEFGVRASATPSEVIQMLTSELKSFLPELAANAVKLASGKEVFVFSINGYTIKYDKGLHFPIHESESVDIGFFEANIKSKDGSDETIKWIRIIACA